MGGDVSKNFSIVQNVDLSRVVANSKKKLTLPWSLIKAVNVESFVSDDEEEFSVFDYGENHNQYNNAFKILKSIRHPNIVSISCDPSKKCPQGRRFATNSVDPLIQVMFSLDFNEVMAGIYDIVKALSFLHGSAAITHNNVGLHSVFVAADGSWKLGCFESAEKMKKGGDFTRDGKDLVAMLEGLSEKMEDASGDDLKSLVDLHKEIEEIVSSSSSSSTLSNGFDLSECLTSNIFQRYKFVQIRTFLTELLLKSSTDKEEFFKSLISDLNQLPEELVAKRLSVLLLQRFVLLDRTAREVFLPSFLTPKDASTTPPPGIIPLLRDDFLKEYICPILVKVFTVHETSIRVALLENFSRYYKSFTRRQLQEVILNELLLSSRDQNDLLVELSLRALADLVSVLGGDLIIRSSRVQRFYDGQIKGPVPSHPSVATSAASQPSIVPSPARRDVVDKLDGILKHNVIKHSTLRKDVVAKQEKILVNTLDLSDATLRDVSQKRFYRKDFDTSAMNGGNPCDDDDDDQEAEDKSHSTKELWDNDSIVPTDLDDLVRSKSLESLSRGGHAHSKVARPVAVIEPKTTYQLANHSAPKDDDVGSTATQNEMDANLRDWEEGDDDDDDRSYEQMTNTKGKQTLNRTSNETNKTKDGEKHTSTAITLLDISKGSNKLLSRPLNLKSRPLDLSTNITPTNVTNVSPVKASKQEETNATISGWDDNEKWEDFEVKSLTPDHEIPKSSAHPKHSPSSKCCTKHDTHHPLEKPKPTRPPPSHRPKVSDMPLGFGYDIKQIRVKVKPGMDANEDAEWKLFEDLLEMPQKPQDNNMFISSTFQDSKVVNTCDEKKKDANPENNGWDGEDFGLDFE